MEKKDGQNIPQEGQPGSMASFNNKEDNRKGSVEETSGGKDESQSYMDYNGNSEENAPARSSSEE